MRSPTRKRSRLHLSTWSVVAGTGPSSGLSPGPLSGCKLPVIINNEYRVSKPRLIPVPVLTGVMLVSDGRESGAATQRRTAAHKAIANIQL